MRGQGGVDESQHRGRRAGQLSGELVVERLSGVGEQRNRAQAHERRQREGDELVGRAEALVVGAEHGAGAGGEREAMVRRQIGQLEAGKAREVVHVSLQ
jgi:hypothetical protein